MGLSLQSSENDGECGLTTTEIEPAALFEDELVVPWSALTHTLKGVVAATKASDGECEMIVQAVVAIIDEQHNSILPLSANSNLINIDQSLSLRDWYHIIASTSLEADAQHRAKLALALAFMARSGRQHITVRPTDLDYVWSIVREALSNSSIPFAVSRSAQGFLSVPLWALLKDGNIDELFRLHVWLPDGKRGPPDPAIHPHQAFGQSWILTGKGRNSIWEAENADLSTATHAEYALAWSDGKGQVTSKTYQLHQKFSTAVNTGKFVRVTMKSSEVHSRNATYSVPAGVLHSSKIDPDVLHATLFFFDASRGFQLYAPVLGPVDGPPHVQHRDPAGVAAPTLVKMVEAVRAWELLYDQGMEHTSQGDWEAALRAFRGCLHICSADQETFCTPRYRRLALREIEDVCSILGRDELVAATTEEALNDTVLYQQGIDARTCSL